MRTRDRICTFTCLAMAACFTACGSIDAPDKPAEPIATLRGNITDVEEDLAISHLRAALLWVVDDATRLIAEDIPIELAAAFPIQFQFDVFELPPAEAMIPGRDTVGPDVSDEPGDLPADRGKNYRFAYAFLVLYDDRNDNGQIDLLPKDAPATIDVVVFPTKLDVNDNVVDDIQIIFVEGDPTKRNAAARAEDGDEAIIWQPGLNVFVLNGESGGRWNLSHPIELQLGYDPDSQSLMCENERWYHYTGRAWNEADQNAPVPFEDLPADIKAECNEDGRSFHFKWTHTMDDDGKPCTDKTVEMLWGDCELGDSPVPEGWPCTVTN